MEQKEKKNKNIQLAFPKYKSEEEGGEYISKGKGENMLQHFSASIDELTDWFKQYQVESLELWISGIIQTGGITSLVVSAKGEGGLRVVTKPRNQV